MCGKKEKSIPSFSAISKGSFVLYLAIKSEIKLSIPTFITAKQRFHYAFQDF